jgi:glycosyltransferase involved in cell wall biosynthesis
VNPGSVDELAAAIDLIIGSDDLRRSLVAKGRERCAQFSWSRCVEKTISVYEKLI